MNNRKSTAILLGALTAAIVFLNYYLVIHRIHFWGLFYEFSSNINNPRAVLSSAVLIGGLTYIVMAFLRFRNGNMPVIMIVLPLLSIILYRFIFEYNSLGLILPLITMVIQFVLGIVPTLLWVMINWVLRLLPFPSMIHTALSVAIAAVLAVGTAFLFSRKVKYKRKKIIKTKRGKNKHSSTHTEVISEPGQQLYQPVTGHASGTDSSAAEEIGQPAEEQTGSQNLNNIYEKHGYNVSGQINWTGSMQEGSCSIDLSLQSRTAPDHVYRITGNGWESSASLTGVLQVNAAAEAINGTDQYDISGTIQYDETAFARVELHLSDNAQRISYVIKGEISNFSASQPGYRRVHLIFEDLQNQNDFYAEGSYESNGLH